MLRGFLSNYLNNLTSRGGALLGWATMGVHCAASDEGATCWGGWDGFVCLIWGGKWNHSSDLAAEAGAPRQGGRGINWLDWFFNCFHQTGLKKVSRKSDPWWLIEVLLMLLEFRQKTGDMTAGACREPVTPQCFKPIIGYFPVCPRTAEKEAYFIWPWMSLCGCLPWGSE